MRASEQTLAQAERLEGVVTDASTKVESVMAAVTRKIESVAARAVDEVEEVEEAEEEIQGSVRSRVAGAAALFRGVQRAVEVWREAAPAPPRRR